MMDVMAQQERQFVIVTPHQSVGKPGTRVGASRLGMTDEQLDDWVDAGHATEIHTRPPVTAPPVTKVTRSSDKDTDGAGAD
jgi:hypothetical protein